MDLGLLLASLSTRTRRISSRSPFIPFIRVPIFTHSTRALYLLNISLPVSNYSPSSVHDFLLPSTINFSLFPALQARSIGHLSPPRWSFAQSPHNWDTPRYLARLGNLVGVGYHLTSPSTISPFTTHLSPGFLTSKGLSFMVVRPFSLAYPLSDTIVTKLEINARRPPAPFTHTLVYIWL